jgi:hypothetical protein
MKPHELLAEARRLIDQPSEATGGLWARAATILARQALEEKLEQILAERAPGSQSAPYEAQLLILREVLSDPELAVRTRFVWSALSSASHVHGYELPPTSKALRDWCDAVGEFLAA